ncbi:uncharacterized protein BP5553_08825 [Venustampulla echinocandica]|uniref:Uncharacterized protein n=1 Tax=Venustampulla echinocandica TaxID=2656787 RepID=A0A370TD18_9HELO|nr:uncharacterized protein BP5553_08825 [Venustampulla echinocandica]RDL32369.1 hypothetical protein BP5553_08825 [Venustampulla echinocandica]
MEVSKAKTLTELQPRPRAAFRAPRPPRQHQTTILEIFSTIGSSVIHRTKTICGRLEHTVFLALSFLPKASAQHNTAIFQPIYTSTPEIEASVGNASGWFYMSAWNARGMLIRSGSGNLECLGNLSWALENLGELNAAEYSGANGAMTLLPTVASLLGASTREMWELYKLMPLAAVLTMFLSLGGTVNPNDGMAPPSKVRAQSTGKVRVNDNDETQDGMEQGMLLHDMSAPKVENETARNFAEEVRLRAAGALNETRHWVIWVGIVIQAIGIAVVLTVLWFGQRGAVIPWWCRCWGWMWFWYFLVVATSMIQNAALSPFTYSYTMRISKAPTDIGFDRRGVQSIRQYVEGGRQLKDILNAGPEPVSITANSDSYFRPAQQGALSTCFYVIVSQARKEAWHELLAVASKASSVIVYAFGTMVFSSAALMSISAALMVLSLILCSAVVGRATAMWMTRELHESNGPPILRCQADGRNGLNDLVLAVLDIEGLVVEMGGNVFFNGILIKKRSTWFSWSSYIGLLAKPFNLAEFVSQ